MRNGDSAIPLGQGPERRSSASYDIKFGEDGSMEVSGASGMMAAQIAGASKPDKVEEVPPQKTPAERAADMISLSPAARAKMEADAKNTP